MFAPVHHFMVDIGYGTGRRRVFSVAPFCWRYYFDLGARYLRPFRNPWVVPWPEFGSM